MKLLKKLRRVRATGEVKRFCFNVLYVVWPEPQRKRGEGRMRVAEGQEIPLHPMEINIVEMQPLTVSYITQTYSWHAISILWLRVLFQFFIYGLSRQSHVFTCVIRFHLEKIGFDKLSLLETVSWILKPTFPEILRGASTHSLENTLTNYNKSDIITKRLVLLSVAWEKKMVNYIWNSFLWWISLLVNRRQNHYEQYLVLYYTSSICMYII